MNQAIVALGSNINPDQNILKAKEILSKRHRVLAQSRFQSTKAIGSARQPNFINGAIRIETRLGISKFRNTLKQIELTLGRPPSHASYEARTIDLDIIVWNGSVIDQDFYTREYLRNSVLELIPDLEC